jgi:hypothetical protein
MRTFLVFLILILFGFSAPNSLAEDLFLVRIVSVDQESGEISAEVIDGPDLSANGAGDPGLLKSGNGTGDNIGKPEKITVFMASGHLPEQLVPGSVVRVWGEFIGETRTFVARKLFPGKTAGRGIDPTGVRRRLGKGRGFGGKGGGRYGHGGK